MIIIIIVTSYNCGAAHKRMKNKEILSYHTLHNHTCNLPNCSRTFLASVLSPNEHSQCRVSFYVTLADGRPYNI